MWDQILASKEGGKKVEVNRESGDLNVSQRKIDPSIIEDFSVGTVEILKIFFNF